MNAISKTWCEGKECSTAVRFGVVGRGNRELCSQYAEEGMVNISKKYRREDYKKGASFAMMASVTREFGVQHAWEGILTMTCDRCIHRHYNDWVSFVRLRGKQ